MKTVLLIFSLALYINFFGQNNTYTKQLEKHENIIDCEKSTLQAINKISKYLLANELDSVTQTKNNWTFLCGETEVSQRLDIITSILSDFPITSEIENYFDNHFFYKYRRRVNSSQKIDYGYFYVNNKNYYEYVPLRHPIDSIIMQKASEILQRKNNTPDEELICLLFSEDPNKIDELLDMRKYKHTTIAQISKKRERTHRRYIIAYQLHTGIHSPLGNKNIFGNNPSIGFSFSSPLKDKYIVEIGIKMRINMNDKNFEYDALEQLNTVNSNMSTQMGINMGYKIFENDKLIIIPKIGVGFESVDTGLSEDKGDNQSKDYFNLKTVHLSGSIATMIPIFKTKYIGVELGYHYTPYQLDQNLATPIDTSAISAELLYRF